jgi:hypothetical protein
MANKTKTFWGETCFSVDIESYPDLGSLAFSKSGSPEMQTVSFSASSHTLLPFILRVRRPIGGAENPPR